MKNKFLPMMQGVVKDYHQRIIPENKVADCENVIFKQAKVLSRPGFKKLGPDTLNGAVTGIAYYEQARLADKFVLVFTARDAYLYDVTTGQFTPITLNYVTGTVSIDAIDVTGVGTTWLNATWVLDIYKMKFGSDDPEINSISFTGDTTTTGWTEQTGSGSRYWTDIASSSDGVKLVAIILNISYIYTSADSGATWTEQTGSGSRNWRGVASSSDGVKLVACTYSGYIYTSADSGATWTERTSAGSRIWNCVASSSDGVNLITGVNSGYIYTSADSGATWTERTSAGSRHWNSIASSSDGTKLAACASEGTISYIYTSADSGATWTEQTGSGLRSWRGIASSSDGIKLAACSSGGSTDNKYIYTSIDSGVTWVARLSAGEHAWFSIASSSDGTKLAACANSNYIYISFNSGMTWEVTSSGLKNWYCVASSSDGTKLAASGVGHYIYTCLFSDEITSVSSLSNLYVGIVLSSSFLSPETRIKAINFGTSVITIDRFATGSATTGAISADISIWYDVKSVDGATGITLDDVVLTTGDVTDTSAVITNIPDTSSLYVGMGVDGTGLAAESSILSIDSATQITLTKAATATNTDVDLHFGVLVESGHEVDYVLRLCFNGDDDDYWSFAFPYNDTLGDKILVATNGVDSMLKWDGAGAIEYLGVSGGPPSAKYIGYFGAAMLERFVAAWTTDSGDSMPQTIELSKAGDAETWNGAYYDLLQKNDEIVGIEILKDRLVIYKKKSISLAYPDPSASDVSTDPYNIVQDVIIDVEVPTGRTVINFGDYHIFMAMDNIYKFNGVGIEPIGTEVINTMKNEWNGEYIHHAFAVNIPQENLYCLFIPILSEFDETDMRTSYPNKAYVYNYAEGTWTIWTFDRYFTCAAFVNKLYAPTVGDIDALDVTWAWGQMRWSDLIAYQNIQSLLLGDVDGNIVEFRDIYADDDGTEIGASFLTRDYVLNDPQHVLMLCKVVLALARKAEEDEIRIRASVDFGRSWSAWVTLSEWGANDYLEKIAHFRRKGLQVRLEIANIDGAPFEIESIAIGFNDGMPDQIYGLGVKPSGD